MKIKILKRIKVDGRYVEPGEVLYVNWKTARGLDSLGLIKILEEDNGDFVNTVSENKSENKVVEADVQIESEGSLEVKRKRGRPRKSEVVE